MSTLKTFLLWLAIIFLGALLSTSTSYNTIQDKVIVFFISLIFSFPSALIFYIAVKFIAGKTQFSFIWENLLLLFVHFILLLGTFMAVSGPDIFGKDLMSIQLLINFGITGAIVWTIGLFTSNNQNKG